ncbi:unnamed protein product [Brachionus calyciflorus]|uniref:Endonuclease/exonuclease/phosphatase domain-containing protein n=1 Tax=Brachionus calyciflorus TaxID=104777 RepID=A0A813M9U7_9BILA|nr:unnamed protein product [Brachionus calyciflorus]
MYKQIKLNIISNAIFLKLKSLYDQEVLLKENILFGQLEDIKKITGTEENLNPNVTLKLIQDLVKCENGGLLNSIKYIEHRQYTDGNQKLKYVKYGKWTLVHTNSTHDSHGTALLLSEKVMQRVLSIDQLSPRIIYAHIDGNPKYCVLSEYAPTELAISNEKEKFYNDLKDFLLSLPQQTTTILAGDFNARIGDDKHEVFPNIVGKHCFYENTNEND